MKRLVIIIATIALLAPMATQAVSYRGKILIPSSSAAWYVYPANGKRYLISDAPVATVLPLAKKLSAKDLAKIGVSSDNPKKAKKAPVSYAGYFLVNKAVPTDLWYVHPVTRIRYYAGTDADIRSLISTQGIKVSSGILSLYKDASPKKKPVVQATSTTESLGSAVYEQKTVSTEKGDFSIQVISFKKSDYTMVTAIDFSGDCANDCPAKPLEDYVKSAGADFGIHGSYFCPPDYSGCAGKVNTFDPPVFDSANRTVTNTVKYKFHSGPLLAVDSPGRYYYYHRSKEFGSSVAEFEQKNGATLSAEIANYPSLIENGAVVVEGETIDTKQATLKGYRGAIGYNDTMAYLVIAKAATVPDMAYILKALGATSAMNLDGGGSSALYFNGSYKVGPGRKLPNAIVFKHK